MPKKTAEELIEQLDHLAHRVNPNGAEQVALSTSLGLIFSWQEHKLSHLKFALEHGEVDGFLTVRENADDDVDVHLIPLIDQDPDDPFAETHWEIEALIERIDDVLEVCQCGPEDSDA